MHAQSRTGTAPAYRRQPEAKRELLLASARVLFADKGFDATSTAEVARHAGVSEGILFHHFGSKKGLLEQLAEEFAREAAQFTMPSGATQITEESVVRNAFEFAESHPELYEIMAKGGAGLAELERTTQSDILLATIEKNLRQAMAEGQIRRGNPRIMAELQFAVVDSAYKAWRRSGNPALREEYILEAIGCMKAMMAPTQPTDDRNAEQP